MEDVLIMENVEGFTLRLEGIKKYASSFRVNLTSKALEELSAGIDSVFNNLLGKGDGKNDYTPTDEDIIEAFRDVEW